MGAVAACLLVRLRNGCCRRAAFTPRNDGRSDDGHGTVGGPFTLTDQAGRPRSDSEFRGKLMIVYFGYTFCPDICPADLMAITQALDALGPAADGIQPIFITIDPERDTKVLGEYLGAFHKSFVGADRDAGGNSKSRQCLQGVLCETAADAGRRICDRPCRHDLSDGPRRANISASCRRRRILKGSTEILRKYLAK